MEDDGIRTIRTDKEPDPEEKRKIVLWQFIGYDAEFGKIIVENPMTGERRAFYGTTWAGAKPEGVLVKDWGRDKNGEQIEVVVDEAEYIDPPPPRAKGHADTCRCHKCLPWYQAEAALKGQKIEKPDNRHQWSGLTEMQALMDICEWVKISKAPNHHFVVEYKMEGHDERFSRRSSLTAALKEARSASEELIKARPLADLL